MRARKYVKELKQLHKEADECMRQISIIGETQNQLSAENIIATLDDAIDELYEDFSSLIAQANRMVSNITQLDEPLEAMVLIYHYHRGYCWEDIAYKLRIDAGQVKKLHGNALRSLETYLEEFEEEYAEEE